jgi:hypothetical protein
MRSSMTLGSVALLAALAACTANSATGDDDGMGSGSDPGMGSGSDMDPEPPARGFQMKSPDVTIKAGQEITYCWYFKTPNTEAYTIKRWVSHMSSGSHHMIVFFTNSLSQPEGTVSSSSCGFGGGTNVGQWIYAAQNEDADLKLPADDGAGKPVGMDVNPGQAGFIQMHYLNTSDDDITVHVTLNAEAYDAGVATTKTFAYVTFNGNISIPPMSTGTKATNTCNIPTTSKIWLMSTHAHKQAVHTEVRDGSTATSPVVFASDDWEHPGACMTGAANTGCPQAWATNTFYTFASGKLTYECTYNNPTSNTIKTGDSAQTDEMCMATGYYFPATKATICYNNFILP